MQNLITLPGCSGPLDIPPEAAEAARIVCQTIGIEAREYHLEQVAWYMRNGFDTDLLYQAAESTAMAPRPTWAYFKGIMRRCAQDGCKNGAQYAARIDAWRQTKRLVNYQYGQENKYLMEIYGH